ncbi:MAG: tetratricopeptide repeat protein [Candidatus Cyclobacteriaceae bacterium M2_1C_046]
MLRAFYILFFTLLVIIPQDSYAQKKKNKSNRQVQREAEFYFTEAQKYFMLEDYAKALVLFEQAREIDPKNSAVYYKMAEIYERTDELNKALSNIDRALKLDNNNKYYFLLGANINTRMGNFEDAARLYEEMIGKIENTERYLFELAAIYLYQEKAKEALLTYQRAEEYFGINEEIISQKQKILLSINDVDGAIEEGKKLTAQDPENELAVIGLAELLVSVDRTSEAISLLEEQLINYPDQVVASMFLGNLYLKTNQLKKAEKYLLPAFDSPLLNVNAKIQTLAIFRMGIDSDVANPELPLKLAQKLVLNHDDIADAHSVYADILFALGQNKEARREYVKALKLDNSNFTLWQNILQLYLQDYEYDSVILLSDEALEYFPNQGALYYYNGLANLRKGRYQESIASLKQGKLLNSGDPKIVSAYNGMLGEAYHKMKEYKKSDEAFSAALDYDPDNPIVLNNYSFYLAIREEKLEKAYEMSRRLIEENPAVAEYLDTHAWVLYKQEKYKDAERILRQVVQNNNAKAAFYDHYGDILYKLGKIDEAVKNWLLAKDKDPSIKNIDQKIADRKIHE